MPWPKLNKSIRERDQLRVVVQCRTLWDIRSSRIPKAHIERRLKNGTCRARRRVAELRLAIATKAALARGSVIAKNLVPMRFANTHHTSLESANPSRKTHRYTSYGCRKALLSTTL
jgi:hypothetical protein